MRAFIDLIEEAQSASFACWISADGKVIETHSHDLAAAKAFGVYDDANMVTDDGRPYYYEETYHASNLAYEAGWIRVAAPPGHFGCDYRPSVGKKAAFLSLLRLIETLDPYPRYDIADNVNLDQGEAKLVIRKLMASAKRAA